MILSKYNSYIDITDDYKLISNVLSGSKDIINKETYELLQNFCTFSEEKYTETKEFVDYFAQKGYLIAEEKDESVYFESKKREILSLTKKKPKIHVIVVTYQCNFNCTYCFEGYKKNCKTIDRETVDRVYECIKQLDKKKIDNRLINIFGGEPLLIENKDIVKYILDKGDKEGYRFFMPTNGYYLEEFVDVLKDYRFKNIQVGLEGPLLVHDKRKPLKNSTEGTFEKIVSGISKSLRYNLPILIRINVDYDNVKSLNELMTYFNDKGWFQYNNFQLYLTPCRTDQERCNKGFDQELLEELYSHLQSEFCRYITISEDPDKRLGLSIYNCESCYRQFFYDPEGDIYPCAETIGNPGMVIGKYLPDFKLNDNYNQLVKRNVFQTETECSSCPNFQICVSGCPYHALLDKGSITEKDCGTFLEIKKHLSNKVNDL